MKIGIVGAGFMSDALATQWVRAGHEVFISGRTPDKAAALAKKIGRGAHHGTLQQAVAFGEVVLVAIRHEGVLQTLEACGASAGALKGKIVIDCSNPVEIERFTLVTGGSISMAEQIESAAPGATVVKAFNLCQAKVWEMTPPVFDGRRLVVPYCGNDGVAKERAKSLIGDLGCKPVDIVIGLLFGGYDFYTVFNLIIPGEEKVA
jgi:8-hydroxy-5-deazaflavin:NADPH oxidoreductase